MALNLRLQPVDTGLPAPMRWVAKLSGARRRSLVFATAFVLMIAGPTASQNLTISTGTPGLVIRSPDASTRVYVPGPETGLQERLLRTRTPEGQDEAVFSGVRLADLMESTGNRQATVLAIAANGHTIGFSLGDAVAKGAFVAYAKNGRRLVDYGQGPYWIVFPWSENPALDIPSVHAMSVWQLVELRME